MPKVLIDFLGMSFFFWSNEGGENNQEPMHVHFCEGNPSAHSSKVWLLPDGEIELAHNDAQITDKKLKRALAYIKTNYNAIFVSWHQHFNQMKNEQ